MKVAILGGTRSIGPYIVRKLVHGGHEVAVLHRGKTHSDLPAGVRHVKVDRDIAGQVAAALEQVRPDAIIDMCGFRAEHLEEIVRADLKLARYVFCSTTAVYGQIFKNTPDELSPVKPKSEYEIGKVACENLLMIAYRRRGLPVTILRLAHPYGPSEELIYSTGRDSLFLDRMRRGRPIIIPSAGDTRIHPIYVEDAAHAFVYVLTRDDCLGRGFNLGGDELLSHDEYFASIARVLGVPLVAEHVPGAWFESHGHLWKGQKRNFDFAGVWHHYECAFDVSSLKASGFRCRTGHDQGVAANIAWLEEKGMIPRSTDEDLEDVVLDAWRHG